MITDLARERQNVFVEVGEAGDVWSACDHEGRRRSVAIKRERTTLVASTKQCAVMRA